MRGRRPGGLPQPEDKIDRSDDSLDSIIGGAFVIWGCWDRYSVMLSYVIELGIVNNALSDWAGAVERMGFAIELERVDYTMARFLLRLTSPRTTTILSSFSREQKQAFLFPITHATCSL